MTQQADVFLISEQNRNLSDHNRLRTDHRGNAAIDELRKTSSMEQTEQGDGNVRKIVLPDPHTGGVSGW